MPRIKHTYRHHKASGQAFVSLGGKRVYLGKYGSEESKQRYRMVLAEWKTTGRIPDTRDVPAAGPTINEILVPYVEHVDAYYRHPDGTPTSEVSNTKRVLRVLKDRFGSLDATLFGPEMLEACRDDMIKRGWCRTSINRSVYRIRRAFKWAVRKRLIPPVVLVGLETVEGLAPYRSKAKETEPVKPAAVEHVEACLPFLSRPLAGMVRLQLLTGMRPGEVLQLKPRHLDMRGDVWTYSPPKHKNAWRQRVRTVYLGPKAQEIVREFLKTDLDAFLFDPRDGRAEFVTKTYKQGCKEAKRPRKGKRVPQDHYSIYTYQRAITRACERAGVPHWSPNQLRHTRGTEVRRQFGLEAASVVLGHARCDVTQVYAEANTERALEIVRQTG
jgi:integrase